MHLIYKTINFIKIDLYQYTFEKLKGVLMKIPILVYPDPQYLYSLIRDASKYAYSAVLTQEHTSVIDGKNLKHQHPITHVTSLFQGSQLSWAALTREGYVIYMAVKNGISTN